MKDTHGFRPDGTSRTGPRIVAIGDLTIHDVTFQETLAAIIGWAVERSGGYVCTPNVDYVVRARSDVQFREAIEAARLRVPDGMGIIYASWIAGQRLRATVTGRLLLPAVADVAPNQRLRIALFGAGPGIAQRAADVLRETRPALQVTAAITPPSPFVVGGEDDARLTEELAASRPDLVFVALGAPRQELWMNRHVNELQGAVLVGVGAALDITAGRFREAPRWMTRAGFEWLYRLAQEPTRLARRYLVDDPWIFLWAARTRLRRTRR